MDQENIKMSENKIRPEIGISEIDLNESNSLLSKLLADEMILYIKTRKFHWNVSGQSFMELHKLFQSQYTELEETIDEIAERINKLGGKTIGTTAEFAKYTRLKESPGHYPNQSDMLKELLKDHETIIIELRNDVGSIKYNDIGTIDFMTGILQQHEATSWILRRYLN
jgi:starvation-inducible DNA-binding protein